MAKKASDDANGVEPEVIRDAFAQLDDIEAELASEKGSYMQRCKTIRERAAVVKQEAFDKGCPKTALNKLYAVHRKIEQAKATIADLERDDRSAAAMLADQLGDDMLMPLFAAARKRKRRSGGEAAATVS